MRHATDLLVRYARFHRDPRNITLHAVGIPLAVFALAVLLARVAVAGLSAAWHAWVLSTLWYLSRGNLVLGLAVGAFNAALVALAHTAAAGSTTAWLAWSLGSGAVGALALRMGHYYEGRAPALAGDAAGRLTGPMFVVAQWLFTAGWGGTLAREIERGAGPTRLRDLAAPIAH